MAAYLRCSITGEGVSPYWLSNKDAEIAKGSSELLVVDSFTGAGAPWFPRQPGLARRRAVMDGQWRGYVGLRVERLMAEFHAAIRTAT